MMDRELLNRAMSKNAHVKSQFLDLEIVKAANVDVWVDFGCADGEVTKAISLKTPGKMIIGYDREPFDKWRDLANVSLRFEHNFEKIIAAIPHDAVVGVFAGSVFHEAYTDHVHPMVWEKITMLKPSIVVVRDMMLWPEPSDPAPLINNIVKAASKNYPRHWQDFLRRWGGKSQGWWKNALHFLLKYRYRANWSYELREDYLVLSPQSLTRSAEEHGYFPIHMEAQSLTFLIDLWYKDLGIEIRHPTHGLLVFKNRRFA